MTDNNIVEINTGMTNAKFKVTKLKNCKYFIEDVTYINPFGRHIGAVEYTVNLMLYPEDSPDVDCAIIVVDPNSFLIPTEIEENGSVTNKSITLYYEFDGDSQYHAAFEAKYIDSILSNLSSTASDIINRIRIPVFYANCMTDEENAVSQTKAEIDALIDDFVYRRHSIANLLWYLNKLRKEERDELY